MRSVIPIRRSGAALVELAVVTPVLFALIFGIVEFGRAFMVSEIVVNASREGARMAVAQNGGTVANIKDQTRDYLNAAGIGNSALQYPTDDPAIPVLTVSTIIGGVTTPLADTFVPDDATTGLAAGTAVQVHVEVDFSKVTWLPNGIFIGTGQRIQGTTVMRKE